METFSQSLPRRHPLELRIPPLLVAFVSALLAWLLGRVPGAVEIDSPVRGGVAGVFVLLGLVCSVLGVVSFQRARTTVNPMKPEASSALVTSGIYRVTRNPMYLGFLFFLLGEISWLVHPLSLLAVPVYILYLTRFQIRPEEDALRARFAAEFDAYAARVRRWI